MNNLSSIAFRLGEILDLKNHAYGDSAAKTGKIVEVLWPNGVPPEQYENFLLIVRILDKVSRISTGVLTDEDPWMDIAGYGVLGVRMMEELGLTREQVERDWGELEEEQAREEVAGELGNEDEGVRLKELERVRGNLLKLVDKIALGSRGDDDSVPF